MKKGSIEDLFKALGFDYNQMEINKFYPVDKDAFISTYDLNKNTKVKDRITSLVYKGRSSGYYVCIDGDAVFRCTYIHKFYDVVSNEFKEAKDLFPSFIGLNSNGENVEITLETCEEEFPVLDLEVENNHTYFSAGILSHNTFGGQANLLSNGLRGCSPYLYKYNCSLILISQERQNVGVMYGPDFKGTGGYAPKYYSSWMARITRTEDITDKDKGLIGIKIRCRNTKNKLGIPKRDANLTLYFKGGINSDDEYLDYLKTLGLIEQRGAWFYNEEWGMKVAGKNGVADFLHERPELYEKVKKQVNDLICGHTVLDNEEDKTEEEVWSEYTDENFNPETGELIE